MSILYYPTMPLFKIIIIGAGPANLMAAEVLASKGHKVTIYEKNKAAARKFLVAGHGGFNLTHSEPAKEFVDKYDKDEIKHIVNTFDNLKVIAWLNSLTITTYIGTSGKVFPQANIKPIQVLQAWLERLKQLGVNIEFEVEMVDFNDNTVTLIQKEKSFDIQYDKLILGLGGKSWSKTGSNGGWYELFQSKNIALQPFGPANSGYITGEDFSAFEGNALKNITVTYKNVIKKGEIVFTNYGIEGAPIYYMNRYMRKQNFPQNLYIDLKPGISHETILNKLSNSSQITKTLKDQLNIKNTALQLLKRLDKTSYNIPNILTNYIKAYPITIVDYRPIDEVISTAGGVCFSALNSDLSLKQYPNVYCNGEMVDWEAPTGGYLLQACFSMGQYIGNHID